MTNGWVDIKNTDMMLIMGGNPAENHPCGFKWAIEAKRNRNAKMIVVDPRFTRTASVADLFLQIRAGTDIAFLGGLIRYAIENKRIAKEYLVNYTNAGFIVDNDFKLPEDEGVFSGFDEQKLSYNRAQWNYEGSGGKPAKPAGGRQAGTTRSAASFAAAAGKSGIRPDAAESTLRVSTAEQALFAVHAGNGGAHHRNSEGSVSESGGFVHLHSQRRRHEEGRDDYLRRRLDASQLRHTDHPHRGDAAIADGQCGTRGRRRERAARAFEHSRRHGYGGNFRQSCRAI